jgi:hypothetical protein
MMFESDGVCDITHRYIARAIKLKKALIPQPATEEAAETGEVPAVMRGLHRARIP